ncbi:unnamed protein product, partial [Iphiclides podalirius]
MQFSIKIRAKRSLQNDDESQLKDETYIYIHPCRSLLHKLSTRRGGAIRHEAAAAARCEGRGAVVADWLNRIAAIVTPTSLLSYRMSFDLAHRHVKESVDNRCR